MLTESQAGAELQAARPWAGTWNTERVRATQARAPACTFGSWAPGASSWRNECM
jgi:hypothetical protein